MTVARQARNAKYTKANSDVGDLPIAKRTDRERPNRSPSVGGCFGCGLGLARNRGARRSAGPRVDAGRVHRGRSIRLGSEAGIGGREIIGRTAETMNMISRNLSQRLERLETSIMPTDTTSSPIVIELQFVSPEKVVTSSMSLEVDLPAPQSPKRPRWR